MTSDISEDWHIIHEHQEKSEEDWHIIHEHQEESEEDVYSIHEVGNNCVDIIWDHCIQTHSWISENRPMFKSSAYYC